MSFLAGRVFQWAGALLLLSAVTPAVAAKKAVRHGASARTAHRPSAPIAPLVATAAKVNAAKKIAHTAKTASTPNQAKSLRGPWRVPTYADSTEGDRIEGEDPTVRRAALDALGKLNGTVVVADPQTGRILTIVNQRLAFRDGFQPCSTVKVPVALAALSESIVERDTRIRLYGRTTMTLTEALARSSNQYFASLGQKLGFERVSYYAHLFGLGEKAGLDIEGEQAGLLPPLRPRTAWA